MVSWATPQSRPAIWIRLQPLAAVAAAAGEATLPTITGAVHPPRGVSVYTFPQTNTQLVPALLW